MTFKMPGPTLAQSAASISLNKFLGRAAGSSGRSTCRRLTARGPQSRPNPSSIMNRRNASSVAEAEDDSVLQLFEAYQMRKEDVRGVGAVPQKTYQPHLMVNHPQPSKDLTLELLLASQAHLGHVTSLWNPANQRYIFGVRQGIHVISLDMTAAHLRRACRVVSGITRRGGLVLFVGTREGQSRIVVKAAELAGGCHLFERWIPGSITNGQQILGECAVKVVDQFDNAVGDEKGILQDHPALKPDLVVCLNPTENYVLLHECAINAIPTIGIIDTDANPTWVTYPIPANDDSLRCVQLIAGMLGKAGEEGQALRKQDLAQGQTLPPQELVQFLDRNLSENNRKAERSLKQEGRKGD